MFQPRHIVKASVSYLYLMILPCIRVTRQQHILSFLCVYFQINLLASINLSLRVFVYGIYVITLVDSRHQHRAAADMSHLISVPPDFPRPSQWHIIQRS
jgi:hypothetical protein